MDDQSQPKTTLHKYKYPLMLLIIILIAITLRLLINFKTKLMPGVMATYYPIQVRSIFEDGKLGLPDLPFIFYFEAFVAKIFLSFRLCDESTCIMTASKITDAALYPLIAIPFYYLAKAITVRNNSSKWVSIVAAVLVTISVPALVMMADFQKNSVGLMWSGFYIYFLYKMARQGEGLNYLLAALFFLLTGLTHLGGLGFIITYTLIFIILLVLFKKEKRRQLLLVLGFSVLSILFSGIVLLVWDKERFVRLITTFLSPFKLLERPMILGMFSGEVPLLPHLLINAVYTYIVCILGTIFYIRKKQEIVGVNRTIFITSLFVSVFLAFPFLGEEWATRLYLMAYVPANIVLIFILSFIGTNWKRNLVTAFTLICMIAPMPFMWKIRGIMCITEEAYEDLYKLKSIITEPDKSLVIARHGLEWWASWVLETDISHGRDIEEDMQENYDHIFYLVQISGHGEFGEFGPGQGAAFPEPEIPDFAEIVYEDEFFILARVDEFQSFSYSDTPDFDDITMKLSHGNCSGEGPVTLSTSPMKEEDFVFLVPYGLMVGGHVTPIDHQYFEPMDRSLPRDTYEVRVMADARIVEIQHRYFPVSEGGREVDEYRIVFSHTCTFFTYYDLITSLSPEIKEEFERHAEDNYAVLDIPVQEGQVIGYIGGQTLDFAVWNTQMPLTGFIVPEHYDSESWKIYTADPYNYYSSELRELLTWKNLRTTEPIAGKIDYDIDGRLIGNWFEEDGGGYMGTESDYWKTHLAVVPDHLDPTAVIISFGDYDGHARQFTVGEGFRDPEGVSTKTGLVKYNLADIIYIQPDGSMWDRESLVRGLKVEAGDIKGCVLFQLISDRKLKMEIFDGKTSDEVVSFSSKAQVYER